MVTQTLMYRTIRRTSRLGLHSFYSKRRVQSATKMRRSFGRVAETDDIGIFLPVISAHKVVNSQSEALLFIPPETLPSQPSHRSKCLICSTIRSHRSST